MANTSPGRKQYRQPVDVCQRGGRRKVRRAGPDRGRARHHPSAPGGLGKGDGGVRPSPARCAPAVSATTSRAAYSASPRAATLPCPKIAQTPANTRRRSPPHLGPLRGHCPHQRLRHGEPHLPSMSAAFRLVRGADHGRRPRLRPTRELLCDGLGARRRCRTSARTAMPRGSGEYRYPRQCEAAHDAVAAASASTRAGWSTAHRSPTSDSAAVIVFIRDTRCAALQPPRPLRSAAWEAATNRVGYRARRDATTPLPAVFSRNSPCRPAMISSNNSRPCARQAAATRWRLRCWSRRSRADRPGRNSTLTLDDDVRRPLQETGPQGSRSARTRAASATHRLLRAACCSEPRHRFHRAGLQSPCRPAATCAMASTAREGACARRSGGALQPDRPPPELRQLIDGQRQHGGGPAPARRGPVQMVQPRVSGATRDARCLWTGSDSAPPASGIPRSTASRETASAPQAFASRALTS